MPAKRSDSGPGEKLLSLYTLFMLKGEKYTSLGDLAQYLNCSKQTVLRLLTQLEASNYAKLDPPIRQKGQDFYRMTRMPQRHLNMGVTELAQLALCRNMLLSILPDGISKLLAANGQEEGNENSEASHSMVYTKGRIDYKPFETQYSQIMESIRKKRVCEIEYRKNPVLPSRRLHFAPLRLISYHESISFFGWEVTDTGNVEVKFNNPLTLYLQRCVEASITRRSYAKMRTPKNAPDNGDAFGIIPGEKFQTKLLFEPEAAAYVHDRQWSENQSIRILSDGRLELTITVQSRMEIISWVLSFGSRVRVLEPEWLRGEIIKNARAIAAHYEKN